jgi:hypothetical protein
MVNYYSMEGNFVQNKKIGAQSKAKQSKAKQIKSNQICSRSFSRSLTLDALRSQLSPPSKIIFFSVHFSEIDHLLSSTTRLVLHALPQALISCCCPLRVALLSGAPSMYGGGKTNPSTLLPSPLSFNSSVAHSVWHSVGPCIREVNPFS